MNGLKPRSGFTIVELLIVVVVIAILAAISLVAYSNIQNRANDSKTKAAVTQLEKAIRLYAVDNGPIIVAGYSSTAVAAGSPCVDGTGGFVGTGLYACSLEDMLVGSKHLPAGFTAAIPANTYFGSSTEGGRRALMFYSCLSVPGKYVLYWTLRSPSSADTASLDNVMAECSASALIRDSWGMRAAKIIYL